MRNFLAHFFLPRHSNNQRARFIHNQVIFLIALVLLSSSFFIRLTRQQLPSVLGTSIDISTQQLLDLTNQERAQAGLAPLTLDPQLTLAAQNKAQDMFAKDYWAHYSPTGESPWDFIKAAGYPYIYAGENLAKGYSSSTDVINAWMASPDHRANMLSPNYSDIGFAVAQGNLPGDPGTSLVVEMFGSKYLVAHSQTPPVIAPTTVVPTTAPVSTGSSLVKAPTPTPPLVLSAVKSQSLFDSAALTKITSFFLLAVFLLIFGIDVVMTENRKTIRLAGHSFDHLLYLLAILAIAISIGFGVVG